LEGVDNLLIECLKLVLTQGEAFRLFL